MKIVIGTRGSKLALIQAEYVCERLKKEYPNHQFLLEIIKTKGDLVQDKSLHQIGNNGLFVREIEEKIATGEVQIGVHSLKDLPAVIRTGLTLTKAWNREDPRDALVLREKKSLEELPLHAVIGTGSKRRAFQLLKIRPDLQVVDIRGNVDTRLRKMEEQKMDGIVLAAAGLHRMGLKEKITQYLEPNEMIPSPGQGILALEVASQNTELIEMLDALSEESVDNIKNAERRFLALMEADCHVPIGAICSKTEDGYRLSTMFGTENGDKIVYAEALGDNPEEVAKDAAQKIKRQMAGTVYLVGAGPGDEELITVKGLRLLKEADCILYDRLSSKELLSYKKPACEMIYVGKASHHHTMKQEEINRLLVQKAMNYKNVVRLKGGDVFVFGRGGEEALFLHENGIPYEVVPGISSSIAGLAYAGIPITQRGIADGFHVVTAHSKDDTLADIDFKAMAESHNTCVFMMGLSKVEEIALHLLQAGKDPKTPAAVISSATTTAQQVCQSDLEHIGAEVQKRNLSSPALIVVGEVVGLRKYLNWFEERPLAGKKYLIPKIGEKPSELEEKLHLYGAQTQSVQVGEIVSRAFPIEKEELQNVDWLIFTSKNGVEAFFRNLDAKKLDCRILANAKIAVIGSETENSLKKRGLHADLIPEKFHSEALVAALIKQLQKTDKVWYLGAQNIEEHGMGKKLREYCELKEIPVYENRPIEQIKIDKEFAENCDGVLFTCKSSVDRVVEALNGVIPKKWLEPKTVISIGPKCSAALKNYGINQFMQAKQMTYESMLEKVLE